VVLVARADGTLAADVRPLVRLSVTVIAEQERPARSGLRRRRRALRPGYFTDDQIAEYVNDAVKAALTNLDARPRRPAR
jgi:TldD protein